MGWPLRACQGGRSVFCTGILFHQTGTRASERLKKGKNRRAFDDGWGPAALAISKGTCVRINRGFPRSAPHGAPKSRVNRFVEADLTRDPRSPGISGQKTQISRLFFL